MSLLVDVEKSLGGFHLKVSFETGEGVLALLGASGCGKSMTLKCIAGIERPDRGRIVLNGRTLFDSEQHIDLPPQKRRVGYLFQQYALFPNMTVEQNIAAGARGRKDAKQIVTEKIAALHLQGLERLRPFQLSGGQQQRVALARILVSEPEALLLDEPFSALDAYLRWELEMELADTLAGFHGPAVFVSHSREEVFRLCRDVCVLTEGRSEPKQDVQRLFAHPETRSACLLSGCHNISRLQDLGGGRLLAVDWGTELQCAESDLSAYDYVGVKSRHLELNAAEGQTNRFPCRVLRLVDDERRTLVVLGTPGGDTGAAILTMTIRARDGAGLHPGDTLSVSVAPEEMMLLKG